MRGFLVLLRKDLREARATMLILLPLTLLLAWTGVWAQAKDHVDTSPFSPLRGLAIAIMPCAAMALSHVVVARELTGKTQLFLEALPVRRSLFFVTKLLLVVAGVLLVTATLWAGSFATEAPTGLRSLLLVRLLGFGGAAAGFFFLVGFLGRYRIPLAILLIIGAAVLVQSKDIELWRSAPLALIDDTLTLERMKMPWRILLQTLALFAGLVAAAAALVLTREGDLPARLAEKMSSRERVFVALTILAIVMGGFAIDRKKDKAPYTLPNAAVQNTDGVDVEVGSGVAAGAAADGDAADKQLAAYLHDGLLAARQLTGLTFTRVLVVSSYDVPEGIVEWGEIADADGAMYRMHPTQDARTRERLLASAVHGVVSRATHRRAQLENRHFLLDGFGYLVARRDHMLAPLDVDDDLYLRALIAAPAGPTRAMLDGWFSFEEHAGNDAANSFAFVGLRVLAREVGEEKARAFLRGALGYDVPDDVRAQWRTPDVDAVLLATCGITRDAWLAAWRREDAAAHARLSARLAAAPVVDGDITLERLSARTFKSTVKVADGAAPGALRVELQSVPLGISRDGVDEDDATREEHSLVELRKGVALSFSSASGDRYAWRLVALDAGDRIAAPWHRVAVP